MAQVLPFYLVCDESASMRGEPINAINDCLPDIHSEIGSNPVVADKTRFCIIGFSGTARTVLPLADLSAISVIPAIAYHRGGTNYTAAFELLYDTSADDVGRLKANGDQVYRPAVFFLSDGRPNDKKWLVPHQRVTDPGWPMHPNILAFGFGKADGVGAESCESLRRVLLDGDEFDEIHDAEASADGCHAAGGEGVVWSGDVVAHGLRRMVADEDAAGVLDPG